MVHNLAKNSNGVFYIRIEDTDQKREVENGVEQIIEAFQFFGIDYDEGMISENILYLEPKSQPILFLSFFFPSF